MRELPSSVRILQHGTNRGTGAALRTGFAQLRGSIAVVQDAQFPPGLRLWGIYSI